MSEKIGILSDIHGNYEALKKVLQSAKSKKINEFIFCGDLVGYYYEPKKCLNILSKYEVTFIKGNHEIMMKNFLKKKIKKDKILSKYGNGLFEAIKKLSNQEIKFLTGLRNTRSLKINNKIINISHGSPWSPNSYLYKDTPDKIYKKFKNLKEDIFILGNTHRQMKLNKFKKIILNPGSVGQPRDKRGLACWASINKNNFKIEFFSERYNKTKLFSQIKKIENDYLYNLKVLKKN